MGRLRRRNGGMSEFAAGALAVAVVLVAVFFAFSKANPFASPFELKAVFKSAQNLKANAPVRIAGVEVGKITKIEPIDGGAARVSMEIADAGLPIHQDARAQVIPRLFLEGNFLIDVKPGSPQAPVLGDGDTIPINQTAHSVSFEEILKTLDKDSRASLQTLLREFSIGLDGGGAEGFNRSIPFWEEAYRSSALTQEALLGTEPGDLLRLVRGQQRTLEALSRDPEALKDLITNLNRTTRAFASESDALEASIPALRDVLRVGSPALASLNSALPALRRFAVDALPGVRSSDATLAAAQPFIEQLRGLVSADELPAVARELRRTTPALVRLNKSSVELLAQSRALSSCTSGVLVPFATAPIPDPDFPENSGQPFFKEAQRAFTALAGESRTGDANGQWFRLNGGSGPTTAVQPGGQNSETLFSSSAFPQLGTRPAKPASRPKFRPDVPCETQEPPDLNAPLAEGDATVQPTPRSASAAPSQALLDGELRRLTEFVGRDRRGLPAVDPLQQPSLRAERRRARDLGLRPGDDGFPEAGR